MPDATRYQAFTITGLGELKAVLQRWPAQGGMAIAQGLYEQAETIMTKAKALTPVDTGNLRASGHVLPPHLEGSQLVVTLGFGGPAASYAVWVHERLNVHHPVGQAKFLETAVLEAMRTLKSELARRAQTILRERGLG